MDEYFERFGVQVDDCAVAIMRHREQLDPVRKAELLRVLQPEEKSASQNNLLNLMDEARENLELARKLRNSVTGAGGELMGTVTEVSKVIMAADKAVDACSKRWQAAYNVTTMMAVEESVKEVMEGMDEEMSERFLSRLESRLKSIR